MADKVRFLIDNFFNEKIVYASTEVAGLPSQNAVDILVNKASLSSERKTWWRFQASGGATAFNQIAVAGHNFSEDALVKMQLNNTSNYTSIQLTITMGVEADDQGETISYLNKFVSLGATLYEFARLYVEDTGNVTSNLRVGYVSMARYIEPSQNMNDGFTKRRMDRSRRNQTKGRQGYANLRPRFWEFTYNVGWAAKAQQQQFEGIFNKVGTHKAFFLSITPVAEPVKDTIYCEFDGDTSFDQRVLDQADISEVIFQEKN